MGSLLSATINDLIWIWKYVWEEETGDEASDAMKSIAEIAIAGGFHYLDCKNAVTLGIDFAAVDAAFEYRPFREPWCTGPHMDDQQETIHGMESVYNISFSVYYGLDPATYDLRNATLRAEAATKILDIAIPWVQNALKRKIPSQYEVHHLLGVVRDVVQALTYGGDVAIVSSYILSLNLPRKTWLNLFG